MPLSALAPDQRAVVQLVLQQERSYDDLAGMLGISAEAVRDRARAGLDKLADPAGLSEAERGDLADYLLGQQSVSKREAVRGLLASSADARDWAGEVADVLGDAWPDVVLPEVPADVATAAAPPREAVADEPDDFGLEDDDELDDGPFETDDGPFEPDPAPVAATPLPRARPRPRATPRATPDAIEEEDRPRSSLFGGALLIGGLAIVLAALLIWLFSMGGDDETDSANEGGATPTATASATPVPAAAVDLTSTKGTDARGQLVLFVDDKNNVTFQIAAENVPPSKDAEAYAVWLTGGDRPHRLGFAPTVGKDGVLATSGPRDADAQRFPQWFTEARNVVVSRETTGDAREPGDVILRGRIELEGAGAATPTPTATPTPAG